LTVTTTTATTGTSEIIITNRIGDTELLTCFDYSLLTTVDRTDC